ncbi:hypothetical protein [Streptomyces natalensis]|uniref:Secreted protein n=1 Tax=Streptomyces natalensis ATCC 27448 TaxID=1240678 RepID=A0A0D7CK34_9ACTN|nr:hypothetical protein [Streptomyces natalensis]KIZ16568.1 hypothetical protein SNA_19930 [Streptomyces natalensis ATCC 27448]
MSRKRRIGRGKKIAVFASSVALAGGIAIVATGTGHASVLCDGLATALSNNQKFIAAQEAHPDAQSAARIANREAVVAQIQSRQKAAGCDGGQGNDNAAPPPASAPPAGQEGTSPPADQQGTTPPAGRQGTTPPADQGSTTPPADPGTASPQDPPTASGPPGGDPAQSAGADVVCAGSTVTLSGEGGPPAASSNQFPTGTKLKVTNLDNNKSTTVSVTSASGSCALLNNAAFEQVREPGKFLIRHARIERVG